MNAAMPVPVCYDAVGVSVTNRFGDRIFVGSVWADNDPRCAGRTIQVHKVDGRYAHCEVLTAAGGGTPKRRNVRILIDRLHPTSTGYALIQGPQ